MTHSTGIIDYLGPFRLQGSEELTGLCNKEQGKGAAEIEIHVSTPDPIPLPPSASCYDWQTWPLVRVPPCPSALHWKGSALPIPAPECTHRGKALAWCWLQLAQDQLTVNRRRGPMTVSRSVEMEKGAVCL